MNYCESCETCSHCAKSGCLPITMEEPRRLSFRGKVWIASAVLCGLIYGAAYRWL
jgi:hypothetical protein